ncbi:MAG: hypothetical protein MJZ66_09135 [Bacteroidales bacterium]|nr:hypothetical protein [Bacteroidales bacterium]
MVLHYRVAIASSNGDDVDMHFGRADDFYIYQYLVDEWIFVEKRSLNPVCRGGYHLESQMTDNVERLTDCQYVVASRIGAGAIAQLQAKNIIPMALPGDIQDALDKIYSYHEIKRLFE